MATSAISPSNPVDGDTLMLQPERNRREKSRTLLILPVSLRLGYGEHQAIIRDISATGMFLYSDFAPPVGAEIELKVTLPPSAKRPRLTYRAMVVRLTTGVTGAAVGIGLTLVGIPPGTALQSLGAALQLREIASQPTSSLKH
jgi:PilZ domain-containing protein